MNSPLDLFWEAKVLSVARPMGDVPVVILGSLNPDCVATLHADISIVITYWGHLISSAGILNCCVRAPTTLKLNDLNRKLTIEGKVSVLHHFFPLFLLLSDFVTLINTNCPAFVICASSSHFAVNATAATLLTSHQARKDCGALTGPSRLIPITAATWKTFNSWRHSLQNGKTMHR
jgi:hypothetical protein